HDEGMSVRECSKKFGFHIGSWTFDQSGPEENCCEICGIDSWLGKPLKAQLHHKNGDGSDNRLENIQFLCPNCHSQTDTYGGRNGHRRSKRHLRLVKPPGDGQEDVA
ncbi:MAG TPA: HNH endonuclease signature motif containing protein, partial [Solirubrobacterales bacterium]